MDEWMKQSFEEEGYINYRVSILKKGAKDIENEL